MRKLPKQNDYKKIASALDRRMWGTSDLRVFKEDLVSAVINQVDDFQPKLIPDGHDAPIQLLDFFSGAGGTSLGFYTLNHFFPVFKMLGGVDIDSVSAMTYSQNFGTPLLNVDVRKLADDDDAFQDFLRTVNYNPKSPTVLIGCAPCQGFSSHRKKHWSEDDDVRNSLVIAFARIVEKLQPDAVLIENVPEFLSKKFWNYFAAAKKMFESNGYTVKEHIYNAASFAVPQDRFRTIVIAMKKNFLLPCPAFSQEQRRTVRDAIGNLPSVLAGQQDPNDSLHKSASHRASTLEVIKSVPHNGGSRPVGMGPACLDRIDGFYDVYGRLSWDKPSITITHYARNPASGRFSHPEQDRGLTAREAARLQSFPDGFCFSGKFDDIYRQIGEAVPPRFAAGIAVELLIELLSVEPNREQLEEGIASIESPVSSSYSSVIAGIKQKSLRK